MSQHDYDIGNADGATVRADLNALFEAVASLNAGATAPTVPFQYMWWADTANNLLKMRNAANNAWVTIGALDATALGLASLGANTFTGAQNLADNTVSRAVLKDIGETVNVLGALGGGTIDIDFEAGGIISATVDTATTAFTFSNPHVLGSPSSGVACGFVMYLTNPGSQTLNFPAGVKWAGGTPPSFTASGLDVIVFETIDGGATWVAGAFGLDLS